MCDGYEATLGPLSPPVSWPTDVAHIPISTALGANREEVQHLQFLVENSFVELQRHFPKDLWSRYVLQIAHTETCIQHALVTLSSYHRGYFNKRYFKDAGKGFRPDFALSQYNLSIQGIRTYKGGLSLHVHLISCLIFICVEVTSNCRCISQMNVTDRAVDSPGKAPNCH